MSDIDGLLAAINARKRQFARTMRPSAPPEAIERLRRYARDTLRTELPEGYVTFLGRTDGLVFNSSIEHAKNKTGTYNTGKRQGHA
jgi:hypothetical protein